MKTITIHVPEATYRIYQEQAAQTNQSASELIRNAMEEYCDSHFAHSGSLFDQAPADLGKTLAPLSPEEDLLQEMLG